MKKYIFVFAILLMVGNNLMSQTRVYSPTLLAPVNDCTNLVTNFKLSWAGVTGTTYHIRYQVQVSDNEGFDPILQQGSDLKATSFLVQNLETEKKYFWRVKAFDGDPNDPAVNPVESDWSAPFNFTTFKAFELKTPVAGKIIDVEQKFFWRNPCRNANVDINYFKEFEILMARDEAFTDIFHQELFTTKPGDGESREIINLPYGVNGFWKLRGINPDGTTTQWSEHRAISTKGENFKIKTPHNGDVERAVSLNCSVDAIIGTAKYEVEYALNSDFSDAEKGEATVAGKITIQTLKLNTIYYLRAKASHTESATDFSETVQIRTISKIKLQKPENLSTEIDTVDLSFDWKKFEKVDSYEFQLSNKEDFLVVDKDKEFVYSYKTNDFNGSIILDKKLASSSTYFWRVKAYGISDSETTWGETFKFTTKGEAQGVNDISGINGTIEIYPNPSESNCHVQITSNEEMNANITLMDILGKVIETKTKFFQSSESKTVKFSVKGLNPGMYFIKIDSENGSGMKKIMVK